SRTSYSTDNQTASYYSSDTSSTGGVPLEWQYVSALIILSGIAGGVVWLGVSVERKARQERKIPALLFSWSHVSDSRLTRERVEEVYFKIQEAWTSRDQSICRAYVTDRLFSKHKAQTDAMLVH